MKSWHRLATFGLLAGVLGAGCVITTSDDDDDVGDDSGGTGATSDSGGTGGGGSGGTGGGGSGGTGGGGSGGTGGSDGGAGGAAGGDGDAGGAGGACDHEHDTTDDCVGCLATNCPEELEACAPCSYCEDEFICATEAVWAELDINQNGTIDDNETGATAEEMAAAVESACEAEDPDEVFLTPETYALYNCAAANEECSNLCLGNYDPNAAAGGAGGAGGAAGD